MPRKSTEKKNFIDPPELPQEVGAEVLPEGQLYELESYENIWVSNCKLTGVRGVSINQAYFQTVQISDTEFPRFDLKNVRFEKCDCANAELEKSSLNKVEFINCRLVGFKMINLHIWDAPHLICIPRRARMPTPQEV